MRPDDLVDALEAATRGDYGVRVPTGSDDGDDLARVGHALNSLLESLEAHADPARWTRRRIADVETARRFLEAAPNAMIVVDADGRMVLMNSKVERLFGYSQEELLGQPVDTLVPKAVRSRHEGLRESFYSEAQVRSSDPGLEVNARRKDGTETPVEIGLNPIKTDNGTFVVVSIIDISERKRAERDREAKLLAEDAAKAKSAFLAKMSHEIRTPMNAVIGLGGLLLETDLDREQRDFIEMIRTSGEHLLTIINDILDVSQIDAGELTIEPAPFDVVVGVETAVDLVAQTAREKGIELCSFVDDDVPARIVGDAGRIRQILVNLIDNAVKFTEQGEIEVLVTSEPTTADALRASASETRIGDGELVVRFEVRDTGTGIPPDMLDDIFEEFSQVDGSASRRHGGTGLGLAISKRLVDAMGGTLAVSSVLGEGSVFSFTIRAEVAADQGAGGEQHAGSRVLIVEDADVNREILRRVVSSWGMFARATGSPTEALSWLRAGERFDVAVVDEEMPEIDGTRLGRALRALRPDLPMVLMVSNAAGIADPYARELFDGTVLKPVKRSALFDAVAEALHLRTTRPRASSRLHLLLVEDNAVNQKVALAMLRKRGYDADVAGDGVEALEMLALRRYDAVFMDVQMPRMDGIEATQEICRRWPPDVRPRIIGMTAHAMEEDRQACLNAGMDGYIAKPVTVDKLTEALEAIERYAGARRPERVDGDVDVRLPAEGDAGSAVDVGKLAQLKRTVGGDQLASFVDEFIADSSGLLDQMSAAANGGDALGLMKAAHMLRSTSALVGAMELTAICTTLERSAKRGDLSGAEELTAHARELFSGVETDLSRLLPAV